MSKRIETFRQIVWEHYERNGRHDMPWRKTRNPYRILVSEVMLQQTQVSRVLEKYKEFLREFPTVSALAEAKLSAVLKVWSGLGYNRRGKYLHDAAKVVVVEHGGSLKKALANPLPGVGPYTLAAVRTFAFNEPHLMIETNIRTVFIHYFFNSRSAHGCKKDGKVEDKELMQLIEVAMEEGSLPAGGPREWYWALMDYGAYLKGTGIKNNARSKSYTKQSTFKGSVREVRGAILREVYRNPRGDASRMGELPFRREDIESALAGLARDGLIVKDKGKWRIA